MRSFTSYFFLRDVIEPNVTSPTVHASFDCLGMPIDLKWARMYSSMYGRVWSLPFLPMMPDLVLNEVVRPTYQMPSPPLPLLSYLCKVHLPKPDTPLDSICPPRTKQATYLGCNNPAGAQRTPGTQRRDPKVKKNP